MNPQAAIPVLAALEFQAWNMLPLAVAAILAIAAALWWFYLPQVRRVRGRWRWAPPVLRVLAMGAMTMGILKPVFVRPTTEGEVGPVLVLVDRSASMACRDHYIEDRANRSQLVALAEMLGMVAQVLRPPAVMSLREQVQRLVSLADDAAQAARELDYARLAGRGEGDAQKRLGHKLSEIIDLARRAVELARGARADAAAATLDRLADGLQIGQLGARPAELRRIAGQAMAETIQWQTIADSDLYRTDAQVRQACDELAVLSRIELVRKILSEPQKGLLSGLRGRFWISGFSVGAQAEPLPLERPDGVDIEATATASDLAGGIRGAVARTGSHSKPLGVILLSDGRQVGSLAALDLPAGVPLWAVSAAAPNVRDLSIRAVRVPGEVFAGEPFVLRAEIGAASLGWTPEGLAPLRVEVDGQPPLSVPVHGRNGVPEPVEVTMSIASPGVRRVSLTIGPRPGEATNENNTVERWVKVSGQRPRVLLLGGAPSWDWLHLRDLLTRTTWIQASAALVDESDKLSITPQQIALHDVIILGDVPAAALDEQQWAAVIRQARVRGGSLILLAGEAHCPAEYRSPELADLLPLDPGAVPQWRTWPGEDAYFHARIEWPGETDLSLSDDPLLSRRRWNELPGFYRYLDIQRLRNATRTLISERDTRAPLLVSRPLGMGRTWFLGITETWRWRQPRLDDFDRFWQRLVRLAGGPAYANDAGDTWLDADKLVASPRDAIRIRARTAPETAPDAQPQTLRLEVRRADQLVFRQSLDSVGRAESARFEATLPLLPIGEYEATIADPTIADPTTLAWIPLRIVENREAELADVTADLARLDAWAAESGGALLRMEQVNELPKLLAQEAARRVTTLRQPLWNSGWLLLFVIACFSAEWALRKTVGLT